MSWTWVARHAEDAAGHLPEQNWSGKGHLLNRSRRNTKECQPPFRDNVLVLKEDVARVSTSWMRCVVVYTYHRSQPGTVFFENFYGVMAI